MELRIGTAKKEMTCFIPGVGMMGYGQPHNTVSEIATPLYARCLFLEQGLEKFILVHLEQCFVTMAIKEEVLSILSKRFPDWKITHNNLAITAQHTHSAPGGYSHYPFYNFTIPGFQTRVFKTVIEAIIDGISEASRDLKIATSHWGKISIPVDKEVAFNRSIKAYANNPEVTIDAFDETHLAVDRTMEGLCFKNSEGHTIAFLNWFGVHCTSISSFNHRIHHDNKGVAASLFEKENPKALAFFLQSAAGDVSPNFIWDKKLKRMRGKFADQYESAEYNGEIQFREAQKIIPDNQLIGQIESHHIFLDMAQEVSTPAHGVAFFQGTLEGPGVNGALAFILKTTSRLIKKYQLLNHPEQNKKFYEEQGNKDIILDHRNGSFLGIPLNTWKFFPRLPEPSVEAFRKTAKDGALKTLPWVPSILPFQVFKIGDVLIAFLPGEITTVAGERLRKHLLQELAPNGINHVFLTSYSNAYMGYIVTPEEYDLQCYEGGHTVYGRNTLSGIFTGFNYLISLMKGHKTNLLLPQESFHFPADELARRTI